jgi:hypothetical protein
MLGVEERGNSECVTGMVCEENSSQRVWESGSLGVWACETLTCTGSSGVCGNRRRGLENLPVEVGST